MEIRGKGRKAQQWKNGRKYTGSGRIEIQKRSKEKKRERKEKRRVRKEVQEQVQKNAEKKSRDEGESK